MKKPLSISIVAVLVSLVFADTLAVAQENVLDSDPLRARKLLVYETIGAYMGPAFNSQVGTIVSDCNCEFTGGAQTGFAGGLMFEKLTRSRLMWGVMVGFENKSIESRFVEQEGVRQRAPGSGSEYTVPITFLNTAYVTMNWLTAMPYAKYVFLGPLYGRVGANFSYVLNSNLSHTKSLVSDTVRFPNGEVASVEIPGAENGTVELQNGPYENVNPLQIGISGSVGAEFKLSKQIFFGPVLQLTFPITSVSSEGGFGVRAFQIFLEARMIL